MGAQNAKADLEEYRAGYPTQQDDPRQKDNLRFYKGEIKSVPSGDFIDKIHEEWFGNYALLERHHGYIQWLFPIREHGMNMQSQVLQLHEIEGIKADPECGRRMVRSYELMLEFYGMKLKNAETGELERSENYKARYRNLNTSGHNYLRITRILKSLGELGFEHLKFNFLAFVADEIWTHGELKNCKSSIENYWTGTLRDDTQRAEMEKRISDFKKAAGEDDEDRFSAYRRGGPQQRYGGGAGAGGAGGRSAGAGVPARKPVYADSDSDSDDEDEVDTEEDDDAQANPPASNEKAKTKVAPAAPVRANPPANKKEQDSESDDEGEAEEEEVASPANANA
ncbi:opioid growth factor receptor (ogfr) region protein, putative [Acanthamoeba castellanii str. Neff]|uniref:Opioid growth factor receptor (Ogfr) region protein, putative n=1 Tax=Acanthamoeba castellanii (strain ATCC 30010 / Neff) TaxID=1257118 RepID=L8H4R8_ACACF|nr:opioid growth factor receptor (ogfr) region protein, putative [Acanthamoeba castellanii str. Neff]ELR20514.1 opioid growth factor receptor (ogfr) region protein, putative [Acanthamoeba castellanii str. Neff]